MPIIKNSMASVWVQPDGCGTTPYTIECALIEDDITIAVTGDTEDVYCLKNGQFVSVAEIVSPPDRGELTVMVYLDNDANWFDSMVSRGSCNFPMYILFHCPVKGRWNGYTHVLKLEKARITSHALTSPVAREEEATIDRSYTISYSSVDAQFLHSPNPILTPVTPTIATDLADIAYLEDETNCVGDCAEEKLACATGYTAGNGDGVTNGSPLVGVDDTCRVWSQIGAWYIGAATNLVSSMIASPFGTTPRTIMLVSDTAATIFYADGYEPTAATSVVIAGVTGNANVAAPNAMTQREDGTIWFVTDAGEAVFSEDNGITWEVVAVVGAATNDLYCIHFADNLNGMIGGTLGTSWFTQNGGLSWVELDQSNTDFDGSTPIISIKSSDSHYIATNTAGDIYTKPIASNLDELWTVLPTPITTGATAKDMDFKGCNGVMIWDNPPGTNIGRVSYTVNGGYNWSDPDATGAVVANTGYNAVYLRKDLEATIVGNAGTVVQLTGLPTL